MENKMSEVAKLLGVKLGEEFTIKGVNSSYRFKLTAIGLMSSWRNSSKWNNSGLLEEFITGHYQISKEKTNSVLDPAEKKYLTNIIKPFKDQVIAIAKRSANYGEFIDIMIDEGDIGDCGNIYLPYFKPDSMYFGMKVNREYTLEQLGL